MFENKLNFLFQYSDCYVGGRRIYISNELWWSKRSLEKKEHDAKLLEIQSILFPVFYRENSILYIGLKAGVGRHRSAVR